MTFEQTESLAEQVRQVHELRTVYRLARIDGDLESQLKYYVTHTIDTKVYFLDMNDDYDPDQFLDQIHWFACENKSHSDAEKVAKEHGFKTELVGLEDVLGFKLVSPIEALKITWGA